MLLLSLPYIAQQDNYSCGPVCIEMLLLYYRIPFDVETIQNMCDAQPGKGTDNARMPLALQTYGLQAKVTYPADTTDIIAALQNNAPVIVNYLNPVSGVGHFAVVKGITEAHIIFADPKNGDGYELPIPQFIAAWHSSDGSIQKWMLHVET